MGSRHVFLKIPQNLVNFLRLDRQNDDVGLLRDLRIVFDGSNARQIGEPRSGGLNDVGGDELFDRNQAGGHKSLRESRRHASGADKADSFFERLRRHDLRFPS